MPVGYLVTVVLASWGVACALTRWPWFGAAAAVPALLVNELPFMLGYLLVASTGLALVDGDLGSAGGVALAAVAALDLLGLAVLVRRALRARAALGTEGPPYRPWGRILRAPFFASRRDVVRVRGLAYGADARQRLDVHTRRGGATGEPVVLHLHGGGFRSGNERREARPLIGYLTSRHGFVCVSAAYRLQPQATLAEQVADVRAAIAWVRAHVAEHGGDAERLYLVGSSAGAYLAVRAMTEGESGISGVVCRYGYYGDLDPQAATPPLLVVHGDKDLLVPAADARAFAERARARSSNEVRYAELPGAHHDFDLFESIRAAAVAEAVAAFAVRNG